MKSLCYLSLLLLSSAFMGCIKFDDDTKIPLSASPPQKWIVTSGKLIEGYSLKPIAGVKISMYSSHGNSKDTFSDLNGNYSFGFYAAESDNSFTLLFTSDSVLTNHLTGTMITMYPPSGFDKQTQEDMGRQREIMLKSKSAVNVRLKNVEGVNEEVRGYFVINGVDTVMYGPILSSKLEYEFFPDYGDSILLKTIINRTNKPTVLVETSFVSAPLKEQKIELEYQ